MGIGFFKTWNLYPLSPITLQATVVLNYSVSSLENRGQTRQISLTISKSSNSPVHSLISKRYIKKKFQATYHLDHVWFEALSTKEISNHL